MKQRIREVVPAPLRAALAGPACLVLLARGTRCLPCSLALHSRPHSLLFSFPSRAPSPANISRAAHILVLVLALGAAAGPRGARAEGPSGKDIENVMYNFINDLTASFIQPAADGAPVRRLLTIGQVGWAGGREGGCW